MNYNDVQILLGCGKEANKQPLPLIFFLLFCFLWWNKKIDRGWTAALSGDRLMLAQLPSISIFFRLPPLSSSDSSATYYLSSCHDFSTKYFWFPFPLLVVRKAAKTALPFKFFSFTVYLVDIKIMQIKKSYEIEIQSHKKT